jgi:hypothetical protein
MSRERCETSIFASDIFALEAVSEAVSSGGNSFPCAEVRKSSVQRIFAERKVLEEGS